jgi:hypothetical protein
MEYLTMKDESGFVPSGAIRSLLVAATVLFLSAAAFAQVRASITIAPPDLPTYDQPVCTSADICPLDSYLWTPGYWAWDGDYYWVPGTWVFAPEIGDFWTPGYWSWSDGGYVFHEGYWGRSVGFYGGIDYGFGYSGRGFEGARWEDGRLHYNTAVNHVNASRTQWIYNTPVNDSGNRVDYNGGSGGITARATPEEEAAARDKRSGPTLQQVQNAWFAHKDPHQHLAANHGTPPIIATSLPQLAVHPQQLPPIERFAISTGNADLDQKYQKQQDELVAKQEEERKALLVQQDIDRQNIDKERAVQKYSPWEMEEVRPRHLQQTQALYYRQRQEMLDLQQSQQSASSGQLKTAN